MITITTRDALSLHQPVAPRGARIAAELFSAVAALFSRRNRAAATTKADDVVYVRRLARSLQSVDPRYAADLYAAADRAEQGR